MIQNIVLEELMRSTQGFEASYCHNGTLCQLRCDSPNHKSITPKEINELLKISVSIIESDNLNYFKIENLLGYRVHIFQDFQNPSDEVLWRVFFVKDSIDTDYLLNSLPVGILKLDDHFEAQFANQFLCDLLGAGIDELLRRGWIDFFEPSKVDSIAKHLSQGADIFDPYAFTCEVKTPLGKSRILQVYAVSEHTDERSIHASYLAFIDNTAEVETLKALNYVATHDSMTELYNRDEFLVKIKAHSNDEITDSLVIFLDVNNFKVINDEYGHAIGDEVLKIVGKRLNQMTRSHDVVARFGGDEFILFSPGFCQNGDVDAFARKVVTQLGCVAHIDDLIIPIDVTIGAAVGTSFKHMLTSDKSSLIDKMLNSADLAMYDARRVGDENFRVFDASLSDELELAKNKLLELEAIVDAREVNIVFQPIIKDLKMYGYEALSRFPNMEYHANIEELIATAVNSLYEKYFFDMLTMNALASFSDVVTKLTASGMTHEHIRLNINIDISQLSRPEFPELLFDAVGKHELEPEIIYLEFTEKGLEANSKLLADSLAAFKAQGFKISMDDFGTGFSSIKRLMQYEFDQLKIDQHFIQQLATSEKYRNAFKAIIALGHSLGLEILAEGIETKDQYLYSEQNNVYLFQGYYLEMPLATDALIEATLKRGFYE